MNRKIFLSFLFLAVSGHAYASTYGNTGAQEIADVVFRDMDIKIPYVDNTSFSRHSGIYVGQTQKYGNPVEEPLFHDVVEMTGIVSTYGFLFAGEVQRINLVDFREFRQAHPSYYGAFKSPDNYDIETRRLILRKANDLRQLNPPIDYVVMPWEPTKNLLYFYFRLKVGETLENFHGEINKIERMRSDAFVEFCYAAAGVPIAKDSLGNSLNLATGYGAATLINMAADVKLFPDNQRDWLVSAESVKPELIIRDAAGDRISGLVAPGELKVEISDLSSGAGMLKLYSKPFDSIQGYEGTPFALSLLAEDGRIKTENIFASTETTLSPATGLSPGYYAATAYDHAGNASQPFSFTVPKGPLGTLNSETPLYKDFIGVSTAVPSSLEHNHSVTFDMQQEVLAAVSVDGPAGNLVSWSFNPPVFSTTAILNDLPVGFYSIRAVNTVGAETVMPFKIGELGLSVSTVNLLHPLETSLKT